MEKVWIKKAAFCSVRVVDIWNNLDESVCRLQQYLINRRMVIGMDSGNAGDLFSPLNECLSSWPLSAVVNFTTLQLAVTGYTGGRCQQLNI